MKETRRTPHDAWRMLFALEDKLGRQAVVLDVPRQDGLDLLAWLGLDQPEFGRMAARALAPLCRRRLWPMARNVDPAQPGIRGTSRPRAPGTLRAYTQQLLTCLGAQDGAVVFGSARRAPSGEASLGKGAAYEPHEAPF